jgi:hypothetical protein
VKLYNKKEGSNGSTPIAKRKEAKLERTNAFLKVNHERDLGWEARKWK